MYLMTLQHRLIFWLRCWENPIVFILAVLRVSLSSKIWLPAMISLRLFGLQVRQTNILGLAGDVLFPKDF